MATLADLRPAARTPAPGSETPPAVEVKSLLGGIDAALGELPVFAVAGGDVNGDGLADVAVGVAAAEDARGVVYVFYGKATFLTGPVEADAAITGETPGDAFGRAVANLGDANGDGYADLAVGASGYAGNSGKVYVFFGGPAGLPGATVATDATDARGRPQPDFAVTGMFAGDQLGAALEAAGDVNGDGYTDLAVGVPGFNSHRGEVFVFHGGPQGFGPTHTASAEEAALGMGPDPALEADFAAMGEAADYGQVADEFGAQVLGAGDVDGDGYDDLLVAAPNAGPRQQGRVYLFRGSAAGVQGGNAATGDAPPQPAYLALSAPLTPTFTATGTEDLELLGSALAAGDLNGDRYRDFAVSSWHGDGAESGRVYVFYGGPTGLQERSGGKAAAAADYQITGEARDDMGEEALLGAGLAIADFDGDGYGDLLAGAPKQDGWRGEVYLLRGGPDGLRDASPGPYPPQSAVLAAGQGPEMLGAPVANVGDVDGDGQSEIAAGATFGREGKGDVYLLAGR
jgi:hypothetical protein